MTDDTIARLRAAMDDDVRELTPAHVDPRAIRHRVRRRRIGIAAATAVVVAGGVIAGALLTPATSPQTRVPARHIPVTVTPDAVSTVTFTTVSRCGSGVCIHVAADGLFVGRITATFEGSASTCAIPTFGYDDYTWHTIEGPRTCVPAGQQVGTWTWVASARYVDGTSLCITWSGRPPRQCVTLHASDS